MNIKNTVQNNTVQFVRFDKASPTSVSTFLQQALMCPLAPLDDIGNATVELEGKAIFFLRHIKSAIGDESFFPLAA